MIFGEEKRFSPRAWADGLADHQQSRGYFEQENVNWKDKATGHPRGRVVKVFPVVFDLVARKMTRHILGRSL